MPSNPGHVFPHFGFRIASIDLSFRYKPLLDPHILYRSASSSSGRAVAAASCISASYWRINSGSTATVGGARETSATNSYMLIGILQCTNDV